METLSIQLKPDTIALLDKLRQQNEFKPPRSMYIRSLIERHVTEVQAVADSADAKESRR